MIHLDFETRSEVDIWTVGAWAYSIHPSTEILCLGIGRNNEPVSILKRDFFANYNNEMTSLEVDIRNGETFHAFNAFFEQCIWQNILVAKYKFPRIPIKQWRCVMAKSLAAAYPQSLANSAKALNSLILKDEAGKRVMMKLCKPKADGTWHEDPQDSEKLYEYCINDVEAEREIDGMLPDLNENEQIIWFLDQLINQRGVCIDVDAVKKALEFIELHKENLNKIVAHVSNGRLDGVSRRMAVLTWCADQGVDIKGYTKADVRSALERKDLPACVRTVLETKLQLGKTSVAKYEAMLRSVAPDGKVRDLFIYHGATTGRWTGKLIQLQNLPKGNINDTDLAVRHLRRNSFGDFETLYPDVMGTLSSCIRGMFIAAPGCDLIVADYNAIEARVVMWLANEEYGLNQFKNGEDLYVSMARLIYGNMEVSKDQRNLGKAAVLGCGFGMGVNKFLATCVAWGIPISIEIAKKAVDAYRNTYRNVQQSWYAQDNAALECVQTGQDQICGKVRWQLVNSSLLCRLPSGRNLCYPQATLDYVTTPWGERKLALHFMTVDQKTKQWLKSHTYGGKLIENITQAVARDLLAGSMLRAEGAGYHVVFSVHDEIVCEIAENFGTIERFEQILCHLPLWAKNLPIKAEAWIGKRYKK